jgi:hypothetical protein
MTNDSRQGIVVFIRRGVAKHCHETITVNQGSDQAAITADGSLDPKSRKDSARSAIKSDDLITSTLSKLAFGG